MAMKSLGDKLKISERELLFKLLNKPNILKMDQEDLAEQEYWNEMLERVYERAHSTEICYAEDGDEVFCGGFYGVNEPYLYNVEYVNGFYARVGQYKFLNKDRQKTEAFQDGVRDASELFEIFFAVCDNVASRAS